MAFDLRKGDDGRHSNASAKSVAPAVSTPETSTGALIGRSRGWVLAVAGCIVVVAVGAWYFGRPSSEGSLRNSNGSQVGTTASPKSAGQPGSSTSPVTPTPQVGRATDQPSVAAVLSEKPQTSRNQKGRDVALGTIPVRFQAGSSAVAAMDVAVGDEILTYLSAHPDSKAAVSGYASSDGDLAMNAALSKKRADAFKAYLVGRGAEAERINAVGRGIEDPIASNDNQAGRAENRRVEVKF